MDLSEHHHYDRNATARRLPSIHCNSNNNTQHTAKPIDALRPNPQPREVFLLALGLAA